MKTYTFQLLIHEDFFCYIIIKTKLLNINKIRKLIKQDFQTAFEGNENELLANFENNLYNNINFENVFIIYDDINYINYNPIKRRFLKNEYKRI